MKRYYFAWFGTCSVRVTPTGTIVSKMPCNGQMVDKWALVFGANGRQARHYFTQGKVSERLAR